MPKMASTAISSISFKEDDLLKTSGTTGKNIQILEELVARLERGEAGAEELTQAVSPLLKEINNTRSAFEKALLPRITDESEKEKVLNFLVALREFEQGLNEMAAFAQQRNFSLLIGGFNRVSAAADQMSAFRQ